MVDRKLIENRKYEDKEPVAFEYTIFGLQGPNGEQQSLRVWYEKVEAENVGMITNNPVYKVFTFIGTEVYQQIYQLPTMNMTLEQIVAFGLIMIQARLKEEVQYKSLLDFLIGDIVKDV